MQAFHIVKSTIAFANAQSLFIEKQPPPFSFSPPPLPIDVVENCHSGTVVCWFGVIQPTKPTLNGHLIKPT